jgi:hypothetical protein
MCKFQYGQGFVERVCPKCEHVDLLDELLLTFLLRKDIVIETRILELVV